MKLACSSCCVIIIEAYHSQLIEGDRPRDLWLLIAVYADREKTITVEGSRLAFVITNGHGEYDTPPPSPDNPGMCPFSPGTFITRSAPLP